MAGVAGNPLPLEGDSAEMRRDKIERLRRAVGSLPRTPGVGLFLAGMTSHVLDLQVRLEDALRASSQVVADAATAAHQGDALRHLRLGVATVREVYGKLYMAATTDCASVAEAMHVEEVVPGISPAQAKLIRELHSKRDAQRRKESSEGNRLRLLQRQNEAALAASKGFATSSSSAAPAAAAQPAMKDKYPCTACNKLGHWRDNNKCRPEDVRANLERLAALLVPRNQLAITGPSGSSGKKVERRIFTVGMYNRHKSHWFKPNTWCLFCG